MNTNKDTQLPPPVLPQLGEHGTLSRTEIRTGVEVLIPLYPGIKVGQSVTLFKEGIPEAPEVSPPIIYTITQINEPIALKISSADVYEGWNTLRVWYGVEGVVISPSVLAIMVP